MAAFGERRKEKTVVKLARPLVKPHSVIFTTDFHVKIVREDGAV